MHAPGVQQWQQSMKSPVAEPESYTLLSLCMYPDKYTYPVLILTPAG